MRRRTLLAGAVGLVAAACARPDRDPATGTTAGRGPTAPTGSATSPAAPPDGATATPSDRPGPTSPPGPDRLVVPVICREAWGARPARGGLERHRVRRLMVHHDAVALTDDRQAPARLRAHQRHHLEQGWDDIAYHVAVDRQGHAYALRDPAAPGDTATDYDPRGWYLAVALGDGDRQEPTSAQLEGLARVLAAAADRFGADAAGVAAHRDHAATSCPGDRLYARLDRLRARTAALSGRVRTEPVCGPAGRRRVGAIEAGTA